MPGREKVLDIALSEEWFGGELSPLEGFVSSSIRADLEARAEQGVVHYGTYLSTFNGRDALIDLYEELLDAYMYAVQHEVESYVSAWGNPSDSDFYGMNQGTPAPQTRVSAQILDVLHDVASTIIDRRQPEGILSNRKPQPQPTLFNGGSQ